MIDHQDYIVENANKMVAHQDYIVEEVNRIGSNLLEESKPAAQTAKPVVENKPQQKVVERPNNYNNDRPRFNNRNEDGNQRNNFNNKRRIIENSYYSSSELSGSSLSIVLSLSIFFLISLLILGRIWKTTRPAPILVWPTCALPILHMQKRKTRIKKESLKCCHRQTKKTMDLIKVKDQWIIEELIRKSTI